MRLHKPHRDDGGGQFCEHIQRNRRKQTSAERGVSERSAAVGAEYISSGRVERYVDGFDVDAGSRCAIRATKFAPDTGISFRAVGTARLGISVLKKRGAIEGPIGIPLDSQSILINALVFPSTSSKSFRFLSVLFSKAHGPEA